MAVKTIETELLELEQRYWQALMDQDVATAMSLTDEPCIVTGSQGVGALDRKALGGMIKSATYTLNHFALNKESAQVRLLGKDVAIVAYQVHEELTVEGKPVTFDAADTSTWVRRDGQWLCAMHTEAIAGDPFGRDRRQNK